MAWVRGGQVTALEGGDHFLAGNAWQIEQKTRIVGHAWRGASLLRNSVGFSNQNLFQIRQLRHIREPVFRAG